MPSFPQLTILGAENSSATMAEFPRSSFLGNWLLLIYSVLIVFVTAEQEQELLAGKDDPYRTGFHFQPPGNWMNGMLFFSFFLKKGL